ncbi:MAG: hypothetical protein H6Q49_1785, partial [Deltaproteobacteria bacterium]|nr:hypothetical protein [Deltaproteobacteria bacterium]
LENGTNNESIGFVRSTIMFCLPVLNRPSRHISGLRRWKISGLYALLYSAKIIVNTARPWVADRRSVE